MLPEKPELVSVGLFVSGESIPCAMAAFWNLSRSLFLRLSRVAFFFVIEGASLPPASGLPSVLTHFRPCSQSAETGVFCELDAVVTGDV